MKSAGKQIDSRSIHTLKQHISKLNKMEVEFLDLASYINIIHKYVVEHKDSDVDKEISGEIGMNPNYPGKNIEDLVIKLDNKSELFKESEHRLTRAVYGIFGDIFAGEGNGALQTATSYATAPFMR